MNQARSILLALCALVITCAAALPAEQAEAAEFGFGYQTNSVLSNGDDALFGRGALSIWIAFSEQMSLQPFFGLYGVRDDNTDFGLGANFRYILAGSPEAGFHLGGGVGIGDDNDFSGGDDDLYIAPAFLVGIQFSFNDAIQCSVDGGLMLVIEDDDPDNDDDDEIEILIGPAGPLLSFSIHYLF